MSDKQQLILDALEEEEFKNIFISHSEQDILPREKVIDVLIEWGQQIDFEMGEAYNYFDPDVSPLPADEVQIDLTYDAFVNIFKQWLEEEFRKPQEIEPGSIHIGTDKQLQQGETVEEEPQQAELNQLPPLVTAIFTTDEEKTKKLFQEYATLSEEGDRINHEDYPLIVKNLLYQQNAALVEKEGLEEELMASISEQITYEQFKIALIKYLTDHPNEIVQEGIQSLRPKRNLEEELLEQIEKYQGLLSSNDVEIERQILRNMITTLVKQLDLMREQQSINVTQINTTTLQKKQQLHISFSGIVRPEKRAKTKEELEIEKLDNKIREIFIFYCKQQYVNGASYEFDRYTKEAQSLSLGMFVYFCKSFDLIGRKVRTPKSMNLLERKRRGEEVIIPKNEKQIQQQQQDQQNVTLDKVENLPRKNKYSKVPAKFDWWNDELKFEKYYKPNTNNLPIKIQQEMVLLTKDEIRNLFKRSAFGKDLDFEEFKCLLGFMANKMFTQNGQRHPHAYQYILQYIHIDEPEEYRRRLVPIKIPFNCKEKLGFRQLPGYEQHQYKMHQFSEAERSQLRQVKLERESMIKEKLQEFPINPSSVHSHQNSKIEAHQKYKVGRFLNGRIDLDRDKISWAKLENLNPNDLSGHGKVFKPQELIDEIEDEEDKFFLKEFSLDEEKKQHLKPEEVQRSLENYGTYKPPLRPTQKPHQMSQPILPVRYKGDDIKNKYLQRANQIQRQENNREQQLLNQINRQYKL